ncbi:MAG: hypothetical protein K2P67_09595 [Gallionellaceae bacterium]|nr:hypothetical protein [Gallionellaceae bacterium]
MKLRINPWFTDSCAVFLNNLFKWYPGSTGKILSVLEWGGGNSSIYFLQKKCRILTIENNEDFIKDLSALSHALGYKVNVTSKLEDAASDFNDYDLTILKADKFEDIGTSVFEMQDWSIIVNDGISRLQVIEAINERKTSAIIVLDNVEYCANWGSLDRCSAHPDRVRSYRQILRDPSWQHYLFEQVEGREGHSVPDATGWEAPIRWISGVLWRHDHLLAKLMVSHIGLPVVNLDGLDDRDILTLPERCPFDWDEMKWLVDEYSNVLTLDRKFE